MEFPSLKCLAVWAISLLIVANQLLLTSASIGVNYGLNGDNLPSPSDVVNLYKREGISYMKLYEPAPNVFAALQGSGITVVVGTRNEILSSLANDPNAAIAWLQTNIIPFKSSVNFGAIIVGNEVIPGDLGQFVPRAMAKVWTALKTYGLDNIKVSTAVHAVALGTQFPPSAATFKNEVNAIMSEIVAWLHTTNNPLYVNAHPYWSLVVEPDHVTLDLALFRPSQPYIDGALAYNSQFEVTIDAFYWALEKNNASDVQIIVAETGWPTAGNDPIASVENAQTYNQNLINLVKVKGTPKRPTQILDTYIFAMFNEDLKPAGVEQNWGLHYPNMSPVYPLSF